MLFDILYVLIILAMGAYGFFVKKDPLILAICLLICVSVVVKRYLRNK